VCGCVAAWACVSKLVEGHVHEGGWEALKLTAQSGLCSPEARHSPVLLQESWHDQNAWMDYYRQRLGPFEGYERNPG